MKRVVMGMGAAILVGVVLVVWMTGEVGVKGTLFKQAYPTDYFEPYSQLPPKFSTIAEGVYTYRFGFNRALVVDTGDGFAVFDPFNYAHAQALNAELAQRFPGKSVKRVIYSHAHLDHIGGAKALPATEIVGHHTINATLDDWPHASDVARVTVPLDGDQLLRFGDVDVHFLYMPRSHSLSLYGIHLPASDVVFAPDMMFVKTLPPFGFPDWYYPGYIRALDRLIALNASHYVPSHFDPGVHADLVDFRNMMVDFRELTVAAMAKYGYHAADGATIRAAFDQVYPKLKARYGDWHGFDAMFIPHFGGQVGGTYLGF